MRSFVHILRVQMYKKRLQEDLKNFSKPLKIGL